MVFANQLSFKRIIIKFKENKLIALGLMLGILSTFFLVYLTTIMPLNWDEAYNLQVVLLKITKGIYGTASDNFSNITPFNHQITTGPAILLPISYLDLIFGFGIGRSRLIIVISLIIFILLFSILVSKFGHIKNKIFTPIIACISGISIFSVPFIRDFSTSVLGEVPSAMYLILALYYLYRWNDNFKNNYHYLDFNIVLSGIFISLSLLTKYQSLIFVLAYFLELFFIIGDIFLQNYRDKNLKLNYVSYATLNIYLFTVSMLLFPCIYIYYVYAKADLQGIKNLVEFFKSFQGNSVLNDFATIKERIITLSGWLNITLIFWSIAIIANINNIYIFFQRPFRTLNAMAFGWILWWIVFNKTGWGRHLFPSLIILYPTVYAQIILMTLINIRTLNLKKYSSFLNFQLGYKFVFYAIVANVLFCNFQFLSFNPNKTDYIEAFPGETVASKTFGSYSDWRNAEIKTAQYIQSLGTNRRICIDGWFRDYKIETLLHRNFCTLTGEDLKDDNVVLIYNKLEQVYFSSENRDKRIKWHRDVSKQEIDIDGYKVYLR